MSFGLFYTAVLIVVAVLVAGLSAAILQRWDLLKVERQQHPWWLTWKRSALVVAMAPACAALAPLTENMVIAAKPLIISTTIVLPVVYRLAGIGSRTYQLDIALVWIVWIGGITATAGELPRVSFLALPCWLVSSTVGGALVRTGVQRRWTLADMWPPWRGPVETRTRKGGALESS